MFDPCQKAFANLHESEVLILGMTVPMLTVHIHFGIPWLLIGEENWEGPGKREKGRKRKESKRTKANYKFLWVEMRRHKVIYVCLKIPTNNCKAKLSKLAPLKW